ncbi:MAG: lipid A deacylase LpxR family protein [Cyclobacteriaceae bacterium]
MRSIFFIAFFIYCLNGIGQKSLNRELQLENDNDAYTLNFSRDQYYSNGVAIRYRKLTDSTKWKSTHEKVIHSFVLNHRIYTTRHLYHTDTSQMDRPYSGQMSLSYSKEYYLKNQSYFKAELELGVMGPVLRTGDLQYEWHNAFGMEIPMGWDYEINNSPIVNLWGKYAKTLTGDKGADIISESTGAAGTAFGHFRQEFMFRFGTLKPLSSSTQYNGVLGITNNGPAQHEIYLFISPGVEYVHYNSTIQGNIIGKESVFTKEAERWIYQTRAGFMMSFTKFDFALIYYRRSKETPEARYHKYVGIRMNQRF